MAILIREVSLGGCSTCPLAALEQASARRATLAAAPSATTGAAALLKERAERLTGRTLPPPTTPTSPKANGQGAWVSEVTIDAVEINATAINRWAGQNKEEVQKWLVDKPRQFGVAGFGEDAKQLFTAYGDVRGKAQTVLKWASEWRAKGLAATHPASAEMVKLLGAAFVRFGGANRIMQVRIDEIGAAIMTKHQKRIEILDAVAQGAQWIASPLVDLGNALIDLGKGALRTVKVVGFLMPAIVVGALGVAGWVGYQWLKQRAGVAGLVRRCRNPQRAGVEGLPAQHAAHALQLARRAEREAQGTREAARRGNCASALSSLTLLARTVGAAEASSTSARDEASLAATRKAVEALGYARVAVANACLRRHQRSA